MKISTKGRYGLRVMIDLATTDPDNYISIKSIAARQSISEKYLEQIISLLNKGGLVKSIRGSQGGYKLVKPAREYTVGQILRTIEGNLAPVDCLTDEVNQCPRCGDCVSLYVWEKIYSAINEVVDHITLQELIDHTNTNKSDLLNG